MRYMMWSLGGLVIFGVACANFVYYNPTPKGIVARGEALFRTRGLGGVPYSCLDCHPTTEEDPGDPLLTPAHSLHNVASRTSWYEGKFKTRAVQGAQACLQERMQAPPLEGDDVEAMQGYLHSLSPARRVPPLHETPLPEVGPSYISAEEIQEAKRALGVEDDTPEGITRGWILYLRACKGCHTEGNGIARPVQWLSGPADLLSLLRKGKGTMPAFGPDRIADEDIHSIAMYLSWFQPTP